jgi:hypothetical protein
MVLPCLLMALERAAKLSGLLIENRITSLRAAVLAYTANLELRTLPAIDREINGDSGGVVIHWDEPAPAAARAQINQHSLKGTRIAESGI